MRPVGFCTLALAAMQAAVARADAPPVSDLVEDRLRGTLQDLAAFGWKRAGSPSCFAAGEYIDDRFLQAGLTQVRFESFQFLAFAVDASSLAVTVNGIVVPMAHDVLAYCGPGHAEAEIVYVGKGHESDYAGKNVTGKVVLVVRDVSFHRSAQYRLVVSHGGAAMLYVSQSPQNLIQIGTVSDPEDGMGPIPAITIGAEDGGRLIRALKLGSSARAVIDVAASVAPATGRNVIGFRPGTDPSGAYLVIGAHYDTWQIGSADNGTGVAAVLELADELAGAPPPRYGLAFVAYDAEEPCLCGGYDYLRRHVALRHEPVLAFANFEIPASGWNDIRALARTTASQVDETLDAAGIRNLYNPVVDMALVPVIFGGIIPTDIQGMYWYGIQGFSTACDTPYYHTVEDTPDKIDTPFLATAVRHFRDELGLLDAQSVASFAVRDDTLWQATVTSRFVPAGLEVNVDVTDANGVPQPGAHVKLWVDVDDFTRVHKQSAVADGSGKAQFIVPTSILVMGYGSRWLHVTAGLDYPLAEAIQPLRYPVP